MTTPHDLLPQWLVHHDAVGTIAALAEPCTTDAKIAEKSSSPPSSTAPPSHITMEPWDDGFTPSGCNGRPGKIVRDQQRSMPNAFRVVDNAVSRETADLLYASAVKSKVWGVYVPTTELSLSSQSRVADGDSSSSAVIAGTSNERNANNVTISEDGEAYRRSLARRAVQELLVDKASAVISQSDWRNTHGVAVWVIASDCDDETEYHLDYAELVRYETNVIVPPLYGATLHVSPLHNRTSSSSEAAERDDGDNSETSLFEGGGFFVNTNGLEHYRQYGYKTRLAQKLSTDALEALSATEHGWQHVPYAYRRGIICDGEFPHFSGRVRSLPASMSTSASTSQSAANGAVKRVVVGFNLFPPEIGALVQKFPEHSSAFNKHVKLSQAAVRKTSEGSRDAPQQQQQQQQVWSLASLRKNPRQAAFVKFLAKKVREKNADVATLKMRSNGGGASSTPVDSSAVA